MANKNTTSDGWDWDDEESEKNSKNSHVLHESEITPATEGSITEDCTAGWFGGLGADLTNIANSLKGAVPPTIGALGSIASFVQRSALAVAAEIAQLEHDRSDDDTRDDELRLPWEIHTEESADYSLTQSFAYQEDEELKVKILGLSIDHNNFLKPFPVKGSTHNAAVESDFIVLDEARITLIRRLLEIDENLAATHAHLSGRSDVKEAIFWTNYFFNCERLRREHLDLQMSSSLISALSNPPEVNSAFDKHMGNSAEESKGPPESEKHIGIFQEAAPGAEQQPVSLSLSQNSLVPADDDAVEEHYGKDDGYDDSSYIQVNRHGISSPPCSLKSVEDLILVNKTLSGGK